MTTMSLQALARRAAKSQMNPSIKSARRAREIQTYQPESEEETAIRQQESPEKRSVFIPREPRDDSEKPTMDLPAMGFEVGGRDDNQKQMPPIKITIRAKRAALNRIK